MRLQNCYYCLLGRFSLTYFNQNYLIFCATVRPTGTHTHTETEIPSVIAQCTSSISILHRAARHGGFFNVVDCCLRTKAQKYLKPRCPFVVHYNYIISYRHGQLEMVVIRWKTSELSTSHTVGFIQFDLMRARGARSLQDDCDRWKKVSNNFVKFKFSNYANSASFERCLLHSQLTPNWKTPNN